MQDCTSATSVASTAEDLADGPSERERLLSLLKGLADGSTSLHPDGWATKRVHAQNSAVALLSVYARESRLSNRVGAAQRGLPRAVASGDLQPYYQLIDDIATNLEFSWLKASSDSRYQQIARNLIEYARARGFPPETVTFRYLGSYAVAHTLMGNKPETLVSMLSAIRHVADDLGWEYSKSTEKRVRSLVRSLRANAPTRAPNYAFPWLAEMTRRFARSCTAPDGTVGIATLRILAALALSRGTGMRASTRFALAEDADAGRFKLTKASLEWYGSGADRGVVVCVPPGKSGSARRVPFKHDAADPLSVYSLLRRWYDASGMASQPPTAPFIPAMSTSGAIDWRREMSRGLFVKLMKAAAYAIGMSATYVSRLRGHSMRSGCATDLLARGVELSKVQLIGGWKSDAVRDYHRITASQMAEWSQLDKTRLFQDDVFNGAARNPFVARGRGPV